MAKDEEEWRRFREWSDERNAAARGAQATKAQDDDPPSASIQLWAREVAARYAANCPRCGSAAAVVFGALVEGVRCCGCGLQARTGNPGEIGVL